MHLSTSAHQPSTQPRRGHDAAAGPSVCEGAVARSVLQANAMERSIQCARIGNQWTTPTTHSSIVNLLLRGEAAALDRARAVHHCICQ